MLQIADLKVVSEEKEILKGVDLEIEKGKIHAIMGPNGAGKSTLAKVIAGHPLYEVTSGSILFEGKDILDLEPEERSYLGIFMSFQYPLEIPGVSNEDFLKEALKSHHKENGKEELTKEQFNALLEQKMQSMSIAPEFKQRSLNEGFSGGEKKRNEILQMAMLEPKLSVLDETDSGLDIDAMKLVAEGINNMRSDDRSILLITHYQRLLDYVKPDYIHVLVGGKIVESGDYTLAHDLEKNGYDRFMIGATV